MVQIQRRWVQRGQPRQAIRWLVTSVPPEVADVARLLVLSRGHWQVENGLYYVKDVTLREDHSLLRCGHSPAVVALLRDAVVSVLHAAGQHAIAHRLRQHSRQPHRALHLLGLLN